jgi:hypothetical protein
MTSPDATTTDGSRQECRPERHGAMDVARLTTTRPASGGQHACPIPARLLLLAMVCLVAAACGGSGDDTSDAAAATTTAASGTTAAASQACADAAALKASMAELDQLDPPPAGKAGIQATLDKVQANLASLRGSATGQWGSQLTELDSAVGGRQDDHRRDQRRQPGLGPADHRQQPAADRHRLDDPAAADRPGLRLDNSSSPDEASRRGGHQLPRRGAAFAWAAAEAYPRWPGAVSGQFTPGMETPTGGHGSWLRPERRRSHAWGGLPGPSGRSLSLAWSLPRVCLHDVGSCPPTPA